MTGFDFKKLEVRLLRNHKVDLRLHLGTIKIVAGDNIPVTVKHVKNKIFIQGTDIGSQPDSIEIPDLQIPNPGIMKKFYF